MFYGCKANSYFCAKDKSEPTFTMNMRQEISELAKRVGVTIDVVRDVADGWENCTATLIVSIDGRNNEKFEGDGSTHAEARRQAFNELEKKVVRKAEPSAV